MKIQQLPVLKPRSDFIFFTGGLDTTSPAISIPSGCVRNSQNVEEDIQGGYLSLTGYEAFDGKASPSSAGIFYLEYSVAGTVAVGNTITGATSGATAVVIAIEDSRFVVANPIGVWVAENTVSGGATITGGLLNGSTSTKLGSKYKSLAANVYRGLINAVPGEGKVLGVWYFKGIVYAFRNNVGSGVGMYKSSSTGWQSVDLGHEVHFTNANISVDDGDTLTKGGVTATIRRVVVETGTLQSGVNTGRLIISTPTGGNFSAGAATATGGGMLTLSGAQTQITIPVKNGRFEFYNGNFYGTAATKSMYGCDGKNLGFEFDGNVFVPINTGNVIDAPNHVAIHKNHLFYSFDGSVQHSAIGDPYNWESISGAVEIGCADDVTGFIIPPGSQDSPVMAVFCRNRTYMLYGSNALDWRLESYNEQAGAIAYTQQSLLNQTYVYDDRGITTIATAKEFGNFLESTISQRVKNWLQDKRLAVTDSHVARDKQQYRLFFNDGSAAYVTIGSKIKSVMPILLPNPVLCSCSSEVYGGGQEVIFFGSNDGFVYQMERGTSFNGVEIEWYADLAFNNLKAYRMLKRYKRLTFEVSGTGYAEFFSSYDLAFASSDTVQPVATNNTVNLSSVNWDEFIWDEFVWDGFPLANSSMAIDGNGENISIKLQSRSDYFAPLKFSGAFFEYTNLRMLR